MTPEEFARWHRTGSLLARLPASVIGGLLPPRLLGDLEAVAGGEVARGHYALRVVVLWAPGPADSMLVEALFAARLPGFAPVGPVTWHLPLRITPREGPPRLVLGADGAAWYDRMTERTARLLRDRASLPPDLADLAGLVSPPGHGPGGAWRLAYDGPDETGDALQHRMAVQTLAAALKQWPPDQAECQCPTLEVPAGPLAPQWSAAPLTVIVRPVVSPYARIGSGYSMAAATRAELAGAHAVLGVASYEDITGDPAAGRTASDDTAVGHLGRWLSFALDRLGPARVTLAVDGVGHAPADLEVARDLVLRRARPRLSLSASWPDGATWPVDSGLALLAATAAGSRAGENWAASGLPGLLHRITGPLVAESAAAFMAAAAREFRDACAEIRRRSAEILAVDLTAEGGSAAQRRARLAALAAGPLAARAAQAQPYTFWTS